MFTEANPDKGTETIDIQLNEFITSISNNY